MAGSFSGHLLDSFYTINQSNAAPFGQQHIATHGQMSFNPSMHGSISSPNNSTFQSDSSSFMMDLSASTAQKIASLQVKLNQRLGPEYISQRSGPGGTKLTYAEGWKIINLANEVFGFNGWSSNIVNLTTDYMDFSEESRRWCVGVTAIVRVTLRDGVFHEDVGYGTADNVKGKGVGLDKCKKEAVTDALKRALRNFGNLLGNCLYDKSYTQEVVKIKVQPPKFDKDQLHRRPEFEMPSHSVASSSNQTLPDPPIKSEPVSTSSKPASSVPAHMRAEIIASALSSNATSSSSNISATTSASGFATNSSATMSTPNTKGKVPEGILQRGTGLNTPLTTPAHAQGLKSNQNQLQTRGQVPSRPAQPNPPQSERERKVTFSVSAPIPQPTAEEQEAEIVEDADESFNFTSDDDAFLAAVDLGEGDLGRPIFEEGSGINLSGDASTSDLSEGRGEVEVGEQRNRTNTGSKSTSARNDQQKQQQQPQYANTNNPSNSTSTSTSNSHTPSNWNSNSASTSASNSKNAMPPLNLGLNFNRNQNHDSRKSAILAATTNGTGNGNANGSANGTGAGIGTAPSRRSATPSMGGFHFPPGVNPLANAQSHSRPPVASNTGLKRSADAMQGSSISGARKPMQGLGLGTGGGPSGGAKSTSAGMREPLGRLELGESGDVKRMKR